MEASVSWMWMKWSPVCVPLAIQANSVKCGLATVIPTHVITVVHACFYSEGTCVRARHPQVEETVR